MLYLEHNYPLLNFQASRKSRYPEDFGWNLQSLITTLLSHIMDNHNDPSARVCPIEITFDMYAQTFPQSSLREQNVISMFMITRNGLFIILVCECVVVCHTLYCLYSYRKQTEVLRILSR